jgi:hypothetical protein
LKDGELSWVDCGTEDIFLVAKVRAAGICSTFPDRAAAEMFISSLKREQTRNGWNGELGAQKA